jgi:hypothetical protein
MSVPNLNLGYRKITVYVENLFLAVLERLDINFSVKLDLGFVLSSCIVYSVRVCLMSRLIRFYEGFGYGRKMF